MAATAISLSPSSSSPQEFSIFFHDTKNLVNHLNFSKTIEEVKQIHCQITKTGIFHFPAASSNLISAYSKAATAQSIDYAIKTFALFNKEHKATLFLWNSLIRGLSSAGYIGEAAFAFQGAWLHGFLLKLGSHGGVQDDIFIQNSLIHFYAEQGQLESARKVFDCMRERNVVSWTSLIDGYAHGDDPRKAVNLFWDMVTDGSIAPNSVSAACAVSACAKLQELKNGERILA